MKIKFWQKDDGLGLNDPDPLKTGAADTFSTPTQTPDPLQPQPPTDHFDTKPQSTGLEKDLSLILAKLDAIKSELDSINQRVQNIEKQNTPQKREYRW